MAWHNRDHQQLLEFAARLVQNRWFGLAVASWVEACAGISYMFSLYSQSFKDQFGYNQQMLDLVGMAKDIGGNVGVVSGWLGDVAPTWVVLSVGAAQNLLGYGGIWLLLTELKAPPPFWLVLLLMCIGTNGATFFNTASLVTCVKNFPQRRGPVVGLLKGFIGLSGALFTQLYLAAYAPNRNTFLLLSAWLPSAVALLAAPAIRLLPPAPSTVPTAQSPASPVLGPGASQQPPSAFALPPAAGAQQAAEQQEARLLAAFLSLSVGLALYLLAASLAEEAELLEGAGRAGAGLLAAGAVLLLLAPGSIAVRQEAQGWGMNGRRQRDGGKEWDSLQDEEGRRMLEGHAAGDGTPGVEGRPDLAAGAGNDASVLGPPDGLCFPSPSLPSSSSSSVSLRKRSLAQGSLQEVSPAAGAEPGQSDPGAAAEMPMALPEAHKAGRSEERLPFPSLGEDHTLRQAVQTRAFWLLYAAMTLASGSGLTTINNLGQMARSLGYQQRQVGVFAALMSVWNFLGRVAAGYLSEHFLHRRPASSSSLSPSAPAALPLLLPRPLFMVATQLLMALGHCLAASALPGCLYPASAVVGLMYGAQWGLMPAVASEVFGLQHFGTLYNWLTITNPTGSYLLSVCVAGYLYDREADREAQAPAPAPGPELHWHALRERGLSLGEVSLRAPWEPQGRLSQEVEAALPAPALAPLIPPPGALSPPVLAARMCHGAHCFHSTFLVMAGACCVAAALSLLLTGLTGHLYRSTYGRTDGPAQQELQREEQEQEEGLLESSRTENGVKV